MYPPLGILYIAGYLREKMPEVELMALDGYREEESVLIQKILEFKPDVLGISCTTQAANGAYQLVNKIHEQTTVFTVMGGPHPTILPEESFEKCTADIVVTGEGEETFYEIVKAFHEKKSLDSILGTVIERDGKIIRNPVRPYIKDLDSIPFPARDLLDIASYPGYLYKQTKSDTALMSARGCPFDCVYCSNPVWKEQKPWFRLRSPKNVVDEMEHIAETYGIREFFDQTDEFNGSKKWAKEVCDEIISRELNIAWKAQMRVDNIDDELAGKLKKSGFWMGIYGLESVNHKTLKGTQKKQSLEQTERALRIMKEHDLKTFGLFMAFNVWEENGVLQYEDKADSMRTLEYIRKLLKEKKLHLFGWSLTTPYPGSHLYDIALRHKLIDRKYIGKWEYFDSGSNFIMQLPTVSEADWIAVSSAGKKLQAMQLIYSGTFNFRALPLYVKKAFLLLKRNLFSFLKRKRT